MLGFISSDFPFVSQCEGDVIEPVEQAMTHECIHGELRQKALIVSHFVSLQVDGNFVLVDLAGVPHQRRHFLFRQTYGQKSILRTVVGENISEGRRNHRAEAEIR